MVDIYQKQVEDTSQWRRLTGPSRAVQLLADSSGVDGHHADGILSVRGQLGKQDASFLPTNLGLVEDEQRSASDAEKCLFIYTTL